MCSVNPIRNKLFSALQIFGILLFASQAFSQQPQIRVTTDPSRVRNGEPILFKIRIETQFNDSVSDVTFPLDNPNWRMIQSYRDHSTVVKVERGKSSSKRVVEFTYTLVPLKKGVVQIPALPVVVNNKEYKSFATFIQVDKLRDSIAAPTPKRPTRPFQNPSRDSFEDQLIEIPELDSYFVRGIPGKTTVFEGEIVPLSYRVFMRKRARLENSTISKFPDFKGFLKEELYIARQYQPTPTVIRGENFLEFELIRYALFPLKPGFLKIEPLRFRSTTFLGLDSLEEDLLMGNPRFSRNGIPMEKSTQEITINVRPLPPVPQNLSFSGAVGQYSIELQPPETSIGTETPFSLNLVITGAGNIKSIEEPILTLPSDVELKQTKTKYEFDANATGTKTFEYILVSKTAGLKKFNPVFWTYFDPLKGKYQTLQTLPVEITVVQGQSLANKSKPTQTLELKWHSEFPKAFLGNIQLEVFESNKGVSKWVRSLGWPLLFCLYLLLAVMFVIQKNSLKRQQIFAIHPWKKTEENIALSQKKSKVYESLGYVDLWLRQRLLFILNNPSHLNHESERQLFWEALKRNYPGVANPFVSKLDSFYLQLDQARFANISRTQLSDVTDFMNQARAMIEEFESQTNSTSLNS
jgi:hypothetical protein